MKIKNTNLISIVVVPFLLLFFQTTTAQNVLMTGWGSALTSNSLNQMDSHLSELGYTVSQSDTFPDDIAGYDLIDKYQNIVDKKSINTS